MLRGRITSFQGIAALSALAVVASFAASGRSAVLSPGYSSPAWAPSGKRIAVVVERSDRAGQRALYLVDPDGSEMTRVSPYMPGLDWPTWSPDSKKLAFSSYDGHEGADPSIYVVDTDGSNLHAIGTGFYPDWSPGGRQIASNNSTLEDASGDIFVMNTNGTRRRDVARYRSQTTYKMPIWSPDGQRLAFVADREPDSPAAFPRHLVYIQRFDGKVRLLSHAQVYEPDWSPDGRRIAFTFLRAGQAGLPTAEVRVLDLRSQTTSPLHAGRHPRWSADGRRIVFASGSLLEPDFSSQIYVMNADGSDVRRIVPR